MDAIQRLSRAFARNPFVASTMDVSHRVRKLLIPTGQFGLTVNAVIARSFVKGAHEIDRSFVTEDRFLAIHRRGP